MTFDFHSLFFWIFFEFFRIFSSYCPIFIYPYLPFFAANSRNPQIIFISLNLPKSRQFAAPQHSSYNMDPLGVTTTSAPWALDFRVWFSALIIVCCFLLVVIVVLICRNYIQSPSDYRVIGDAIIDDNDLPIEFLNDEESLIGLAEEYNFKHLLPEEQASYFRGEQFSRDNPPHLDHTRGRSMTREDETIVKERGILAFEFEQDLESLQPRYIVEDRTEINFIDTDSPYATATTVLNYCLPVRNRTYSDCIYFETKVFEFENGPNSHFSIGLVSKPYPSFRLPGYNNFSIAYESTGNLKINKPFPTPLQQHWGSHSFYNALVLPPLSQSDVVGFGYHIFTGTVFITRNGRKLMDVMKGLYVDMFPAIGCFLTNGKFQVNLGQLGFVWIEANVKKYGFISTSDYKKLQGDRGLASLPQYGTTSNLKGDQLLAKGEELPPVYPEEELDFFGRSRYLIASSSRNPESSNEKLKEKNSNSMITDEPEEIMDLRERLYEQHTTTSGHDSSSSHNESVNAQSSILGSESPVNYGSTKDEPLDSSMLESSHLSTDRQEAMGESSNGPANKSQKSKKKKKKSKKRK